MKFNEHNCTNYILSYLPNFKPKVLDYHNELKDNPTENPTLCGDLTELVDFYKDLKESPKVNRKEIIEIFKVMEELAAQGDKNVKGALEVCFFESIINSLGTDEKALKEFFKMLGPASLELCKQNDAFWGTRTPGLYESNH
ncbi:hypothetical protein IM40_09880 (plasmid) [Candidatus Paracaedimonas acanthamoebae]|nr:hypothetical protein IM40_09880 [Candidatus Paracaedimonas acanthamoebae]